MWWIKIPISWNIIKTSYTTLDAREVHINTATCMGGTKLNTQYNNSETFDILGTINYCWV